MHSVKVWDLFVRIFHWSLVASMIGLLVSGEEFEGLHVRLGYFVVGLVCARIAWGFVGTRYARFKDFLYGPGEIYRYLRSLAAGNPVHYLGHNPAGGLMIAVMLVALLATAFSGLKALAAEGRGPLADGGVSVTRAAHADDDERDEYEERRYGSGKDSSGGEDEFWEEIHELMTSVMIVLIVLHLCGVLVSSLLHRENLVSAMVTGKKNRRS